MKNQRKEKMHLEDRILLLGGVIALGAYLLPLEIMLYEATKYKIQEFKDKPVQIQQYQR